MFHISPEPPLSPYILPKGILRRCLGLALGLMWDTCVFEISFHSKNASGRRVGVPGTPRWVLGCGPAGVPETRSAISTNRQRDYVSAPALEALVMTTSGLVATRIHDPLPVMHARDATLS